VPFLKLMGYVCGGWQMASSALAAQALLSRGEGDPDFLRAKIATARFFSDYFLTQVPGLRDVVVGGAPAVLALADEQV
jgi:butyryl-CoA dehydrogenase